PIWQDLSSPMPFPPRPPLFPYTTLFRSLVPSPAGAPQPTTLDGQPLDGSTAALVFKTVADPFGKLSLFRVFGGTVKADSHLYNVDRKSTRLNSSHVSISYAVFCLKKKTN